MKLTDGAGVAETKEFVNQMEERGIRVIGIGIGAGTEAVNDVYTNSIQQSDINNLSIVLLQAMMMRMMGVN